MDLNVASVIALGSMYGSLIAGDVRSLLSAGFVCEEKNDFISRPWQAEPPIRRTTRFLKLNS